ncbi:MAG: calycin-like domain-containing protein [Prevotella sp.]|nr:calycin-like domain-containing protein [Prevotella sp.]
MTKEKIFRYWFVLVVLAIGFTTMSCSDDDEDNNQINWSSLEGSYTGTLTMSMQYANLSFDAQTIVLSKDGKNTAKLSYTGDCGNFELTSIAVTENSNGSYTIYGSGLFNMQMSADYLEKFGMSSNGISTGTPADYACTVSGTINSKTDFNIVLTLPSVMGGTTLTLTPASQE